MFSASVYPYIHIAIYILFFILTYSLFVTTVHVALEAGEVRTEIETFTDRITSSSALTEAAI